MKSVVAQKLFLYPVESELVFSSLALDAINPILALWFILLKVVRINTIPYQKCLSSRKIGTI